MLRLLGLLGGLSAATDLGAGAPLEESLRRAVLSVRLAHAVGCPSDETRGILYTGLLQHLGCTAFAHELALLLGDDLAVTRASFLVDADSRADVLRTFVPAAAEAAGRSRVRTLATLVTQGARLDREGPHATCEVASRAASRLGLPDAVATALAHVTCRWDGGGYPAVAREGIPVPTRVMHVASVATMFCLAGGPERGLAEVRRRSGRELDPSFAQALSVDMLADLADLDGSATLLECEPDPVLRVDRPDVMRVAEVFGDLTDLKSTWFHGHSAAVAELAAAAATNLGLGTGEVADVRLAGHLHDVGRVGVSNRIWQRVGRLTSAERAQVELHPWHTEQVLAGIPELAAVSRIAGAHHERLDGSGYHRRATGPQLDLASRTLAAADLFRTKQEGRPHRPALGRREAAATLRREAAEGRLDPDAVAAVLAAAGSAPGRARVRPAGLTDRQVDVLRLLAAGRSNREIAEALVISPRTAEHHVQDVYTRIGTSSRAAAALFAMEHGLLGEPG